MSGSHFEPELAHLRPARSVTVIWMSLAAATAFSWFEGRGMILNRRTLSSEAAPLRRSEHRRRPLGDCVALAGVRLLAGGGERRVVEEVNDRRHRAEPRRDLLADRRRQRRLRRQLHVEVP